MGINPEDISGSEREKMKAFSKTVIHEILETLAKVNKAVEFLNNSVNKGSGINQEEINKEIRELAIRGLYSVAIWKDGDFKILREFCKLDEDGLLHLLTSDEVLRIEDYLNIADLDIKAVEDSIHNFDDAMIHRVEKFWSIDSKDQNRVVQTFQNLANEINEQYVNSTSLSINTHNAKKRFLEFAELSKRLTLFIDNIKKVFEDKAHKRIYDRLVKKFETQVDEIKTSNKSIHSALYESSSEYVTCIIQGKYEQYLSEHSSIETLKQFDLGAWDIIQQF
jgi:hypothetical protein